MYKYTILCMYVCVFSLTLIRLMSLRTLSLKIAETSRPHLACAFDPEGVVIFVINNFALLARFFLIFVVTVFGRY